MKKTSYDWSDAVILASVIEKLQIEKFIVAPSDTILGLLAKASEGGFEALQVVKKREDKPFLVLVNSLQQAQRFAQEPFGGDIERMLADCWPGPLTLVFKAQAGVPAYMLSRARTIAVRVPRHAILQHLIAQVGPLFSTSANKPGEPVALDVRDVDAEILEHAALVIAGNSDAQPSTILDITGNVPRIVREGAYRRDHLEQLYGKPLL